MAFALVTSVEAMPGENGGTSGSIDTTGASLLVIHASSNVSVTSVSDSKGNTWNPRTEHSRDGRFSRLWEAVNPTVGSGHTFTVSGTGTFPHFAAAAFSGANTSSPFDQENGSNATMVTSLATGSVTPTENDELVVAGICAATSEPTIDSGFTIAQAELFVGGVNMSGGLAYKIQTTAAAVNPTWSFTESHAAASIATFKAAAAAAGHPAMRRGGMACIRPVEIGREGVSIMRVHPRPSGLLVPDRSLILPQPEMRTAV